MSILGRILRWRGVRRFGQLLARSHGIAHWQERNFRRFVARGSRAEQGRTICPGGLASITSIADYQARVPVCTHEDVFPLWDRAMHGEPDVIWPGYIRYWGMSSGTSNSAGSNKYIPLSADTIRTNMQGGFDSVASYLWHSRDAGLLEPGSRMLFLGGSTSLTEIPSRVRPGKPNWHGDNTGVAAQFIPWWVQRFYSPGRDLAWLDDWEEKVTRIAEQAVTQDIRFISGVPSWMAILFDRVRALSGGKLIGEVWPNLRAYVHGGMSFEPYRDLFAAQIGREIACIDTWSATEGGILSVADRPPMPGRAGGDHAMLPLFDLGVFFEFVPVALADQRHPEAHTLDRVQADVEYVVVMTTNAGLFRYVVGDTVKFVETKPPRLLFSGRLSAFLNFFGEHVILSELDSAIAAASRETGSTVKDYTVVPLFPTPQRATPGHRWYVEFGNGSPDLAQFSKALDADIRGVSRNLDYDSHRKADLGLMAPDVVAVPPGTFYEWMKQRGKLGGQNKVPRALTDRELIDSFTAVATRTQQARADE
ncbi:MAG: GH3 auxin-responsive promoter family protein [Planctomycetota bacterium]